MMAPSAKIVTPPDTEKEGNPIPCPRGHHARSHAATAAGQKARVAFVYKPLPEASQAPAVNAIAVTSSGTRTLEAAVSGRNGSGRVPPIIVTAAQESRPSVSATAVTSGSRWC